MRTYSLQFLVVLGLLLSRPALTCSFIGDPPSTAFLDMADAVFVGTVTSVSPFDVPRSRVEVEFSVEWVWKGTALANHRHVLTATPPTYIPAYRPGETYIVLASQRCGMFETSVAPCAELGIYTPEELTAYLGAPRRPQFSSSSDPVPSRLHHFQQQCVPEEEATRFVLFGIAALGLSVLCAAMVRLLWYCLRRRSARQREATSSERTATAWRDRKRD